jgi:hypothetical protein
MKSTSTGRNWRIRSFLPASQRRLARRYSDRTPGQSIAGANNCLRKKRRDEREWGLAVRSFRAKGESRCSRTPVPKRASVAVAC